MFIKKYLAPLGAVAVFAAMTLALVAGGRTAEAATVTTRADAATVTTSASGTPVTLAVTFAANELDANGENFTITLPPGFVFTAAPTVTLANAAGMTAITCALGNSGQADGANNDLATCTATGGNTGTPTATISMNVRYTGAQTNLTNALLNGGTGSGNIQIGAGPGGVTAIADAGTLQVAYVSAGPIVVTTSPAVTSLPADGSSTVLLQATVTDAGGTRVANRAVNWTVSLGIVGTGTAKTITSFTNSNGVATVTALNAVGTRAISLVAATGTTASKITFNAPTQMAVAATVTNTSPGYISPTTGTNVSVKVADAAGLGVNGQVLLVTTDKGFLVNGFGGACPGNTRAVSPTSA
ncbi:MAG: Ig-like domain-containing protein, partial [Chloroflexi bacterium]|nr:Ig-like domain-containing protein [Chloroflexota bacterium]